MGTAREGQRSARRLLLVGVAVPILYFGIVLVASATWPAYSHVTQYVSELGSADAPYPWLFNAGILATGAAAVVAAVGMLRHFLAEARPASGSVASLALAAWGAGMLFGGWFPMPDPRHNGYGLIMGIAVLPMALMLALRGRVGVGVKLFLAVWQVATAALLAVLFGVGSLVTLDNVGLWQRALAVAMIPGIGVACGILAARARSAAASR
jgi:hypothetical protein